MEIELATPHCNCSPNQTRSILPCRILRYSLLLAIAAILLSFSTTTTTTTSSSSSFFFFNIPMGSRGANMVLSRANRIRTKLQSALEASSLEIEDVSYQHAGHAAMKGTTAQETHFNLKIVSPKFDGQSLVKRHRMVYDLLADELQSGLHALSIVAKTPKETGSN